MRAAARGALAGSPSPIVLVDSKGAGSAGSSAVVPAPTGIADGDLLLAFIYTSSGSLPTFSATGFTLVASSRANGGLGIMTKTAASESGSYTLSSGLSQTDGIVACVRSTSGIDGSVAFDSGGNTTLMVAPSVTPSSAADMLLCLYAWFSTGFPTAPTGMTAGATAAGSSNEEALFFQSLSSGSATGTRTADLVSTLTGGGYIGMSLLLSPK